ncbi:uncharacterized protein LOC134762935 [Penaeus indicus]|uniref:uncharacterized protein LOC134762935 n=1 Tax=Penaeus indicus TaxID=29960 RepID=UPI00300D3EAB
MSNISSLSTCDSECCHCPPPFHPCPHCGPPCDPRTHMPGAKHSLPGAKHSRPESPCMLYARPRSPVIRDRSRPHSSFLRARSTSPCSGCPQNLDSRLCHEYACDCEDGRESEEWDRRCMICLGRSNYFRFNHPKRPS